MFLSEQPETNKVFVSDSGVSILILQCETVKKYLACQGPRWVFIVKIEGRKSRDTYSLKIIQQLPWGVV